MPRTDPGRRTPLASVQASVARLTGPGLLLGALVLAATLLLPAVPALGQDSGESIGGRIQAGGVAIPGVQLQILDSAGELVVVATTDADGSWSVPLPGPDTYTVVLDTATLPDGVEPRDPDNVRREVRIGIGARSTALFPLGSATETTGPSRSATLAQSVYNGLKFGLIIAMTAIGLSLIFGTTGLINFAHGDLVALGAFLALLFNTTVGLHLIPAGILAIVLTAGVSAGIDRGLWRPLRQRRTGLIAMLVVSIGLAFVIRHLLLFFFGGQRRSYVNYTLQQSITIGPVRAQPSHLWVMALSVLILVAVGLMLTRTRIGKGMRAVADDRDLAESSGIDVQRVILSVWALGGALTAAGGVFLGTVESLDYLMGFRLLLLMFAGVILGGLGTAFGAMLGSLLIGLVSEVSTVFFSSQLKYVWALAVMILVLLVRPQGLLGQKERIG